MDEANLAEAAAGASLGVDERVAGGLQAAELAVNVAHLEGQVVQPGAAALDEPVDDVLVMPGAAGTSLDLAGGLRTQVLQELQLYDRRW